MTGIYRYLPIIILLFVISPLCEGAHNVDKIVSQPLYKTWWANMTYILLILGAAVLYVVHIKNRQKKRLADLEREFTEEVQKTKSETVESITEELSVLITFILGLSAQVRQQIGYSHTASGKLSLMEYNIGKINQILNILQDSKGFSEKINDPREMLLLPVSQLTMNLLEILKVISNSKKVKVNSDIEEGIILMTYKDYYQTLFNSLTHKLLSITSGKGGLYVSLQKTDKENGIVLSIKADTSKESYIEFMSEKNVIHLHNKLVENVKGIISYDYEGSQFIVTVFLPQDKEIELAAELNQTYGEKIPANTIITDNQLPMGFNINSGNEYIFIISTNKYISSFIGYFLSLKYNIVQFEDNMTALQSMDSLLPAAIIYDYSSLRTCFTEFVNNIRSNKRTQHITVIALTSSIHINERQESTKLGADLCISFPFNVEYLQDVLEKQIDKREKIAEYFNSPLSSYEKKDGKFIHLEDKAFYHRILDIIHENISNPELNASLIAKELGISIRVMYRKLENIDSPNLNQLIIDTRLKLAVKYLTKTKMTIDEVLYKVGYENRSTFYRNFKNSYGMTPKEYREQIQSKTLKVFN